MNAVGIDVSKGKSMVAVMRPFGEVVLSPFEVSHSSSELSKLARLLKSLDGESRVILESTGNYHAPVAKVLHDAGVYVSVVNAMLVHGYGNNSLRRAKTDKKDAVKLANFGLDHWLSLPRYVPDEDTRLLLKSCYRQYQQYAKFQTMMKNNLISLLDVMPKTDTTKLLVRQAITQLRTISSAKAALQNEMETLAASLPEYPVVMDMFGVGPKLGPQLMAEIGDVRRFHSKKALVAYAGIDAPPYQSGQLNVRSRSISKRGSPALRRTLFLVMSVYLKNSPEDEPVYQYMAMKRAQGKPYLVYMMASANKFLRRYYATVKAYLNALEQG